MAMLALPPLSVHGTLSTMTGSHPRIKELADPVRTKVTIFSLVKIFEKEEYAQSFLNGSLYMNPLSYFRKYRDENGELRGDSWEGIGALYQPAQLGELRIGETVIPPSDLAGPIRVGHVHLEHAKVFCTYALNDGGFDEDTADHAEELMRLFAMHESCYRLGRFAAVVVNPTEFFERVRAAVRQLRPPAFTHGLVRYFDENSHHGVLGEHPGFYKRRRYQRQREHRIMVELPDSTEPLVLEVGNLSDIAVLTSPNKINAGLSIAPANDSAVAD